jgi:ParB family chromosome partitioning protein
MQNRETTKSVVNIPLDRVSLDPTQPRKSVSEQYIQELAESIQQDGLLNPIRVFQVEPFLYVVETGECRYRAFQYLKETTIPCLVTEKKPKRTLSNMRLAENLHRKDLSDAELCQEFAKRIADGESQEEIAKAIHRSRAFVTQRLLILERPEIFSTLQSGKIGFAQARDLVFKKPESKEKCYAVTSLAEVLPTLQVPQMFADGEVPDDVDKLYDAYTSDLVKLRRIM